MPIELINMKSQFTEKHGFTVLYKKKTITPGHYMTLNIFLSRQRSINDYVLSVCPSVVINRIPFFFRLFFSRCHYITYHMNASIVKLGDFETPKELRFY